MSASLLRALLAGLCLAASGGLSALAADADAWEGGRPLTRVFTRFDYRAASGNWALAEGPEGIVWAGNNQGLLEYDGADWRLLPLPNGSAVRSLVRAPDGLCYVGGQDELGVLEVDATGTRRYRSLLAHLPEADRACGDVWSVHALAGAVWFKTTAAVFVWRKGAMEVIRIESTTGSGLEHAGRLHIFNAEKGLVAVSTPGETHVVPGSAALCAEKALVRGAWTLADGTTILATEASGLWRWTETGLSSWRVPAEAWLRENRVYSGTRLADGRLALGTVRGGVALLRADGHWDARLGRAQGLPDSPVLSVREDRAGGLWLALENGLVRTEPTLPVRSYAEPEGVRGIVNDSVRFAGRRYAATSLGLVRLRAAATPAEDAGFEPVPGVAKECWSVLVAGEELLTCAADGVWLLGSAPGAEARQLTRQYAYAACASRRHAGLVYIALRQGVTALQRGADGTWRELDPLIGTKDEVWSLLEDADGALWAGTPYRGVWRADLREGYWADAAIRVFGEADGLPGGSPAMVTRLDGRLVVASDAGLFRLDPTGARFATFTEGGAPREPVLGIVGESTGERVYLTREKGGRFGLWRWPAADGGTRPAPVPVREFAPFARFECWELTRESDGTMWVGGSEGLLRLRSAAAPAVAAQMPRTLLRRWEAGGVLLHGGAPETPAPRPELPITQSRLRFAVGATAFTPEWGGPAVRFRWRLDGLDPDWTPWQAEFAREFTGLAEGAYTLRVQAQDAFGVAGPELTVPFRILPPWQRTPWAYAAWLALAAAGVTALLRWRLGRQRAELLLSQRTRERLLRAETLARDAQLSALRYQINPHFLFNALNAVRARIGESPEAARSMIGHLAGYFRRTLEAGSAAAVVPLRDEFAALEDYVALERARFGGRLELSLHCDPAVVGQEIPALLLQPLVENAVKYGAATTPEHEPIRVEVRAAPAADGGLEIVVRNTGSWIVPGRAAPAESTGTGLANVRERLAQWRPDRHRFEIGPAAPGGGEARLHLPTAP